MNQQATEALIHLNTIRAMVCKALRAGDLETVSALLVAEAQASTQFNQEVAQ